MRQQRLSTTALLLIFVCFLTPCVRAQDDASSLSLTDVREQNGVLLLSASDLPAAVTAFHPLFVLFDSPMRNGSLELFRAFGDAAVALRASQRELAPRLRFASIDATEPSSLPEVLNIQGLPAMVRFRCSPKVTSLLDTPVPDINVTTSATDMIIITTTVATSTLTECSLDDADVGSYTGGRSSAELQRFMLDQPQKEVTVLYDRFALEALVASHPFVVLVVVDDRDTQPYFDASSLAQTDVHVISSYAVTANRALLDNDEERQRIPSVVAFRDFGNTRIVYNGPWKKSAIASFLQLNKYSLVSTYTPQFSGYFFDARATAHVLLFSDASEVYHELLLSQAQELAQQYASALGGAITLRFVFVPKYETELRAAMFVMNHHVPMVLIVEDVGAPPLRFKVFGEDLVVALDTLAFKSVLGGLLATKFPPVFGMADDVNTMVIYDNLGFEDITTIASSKAPTSSSVVVVTEEPRSSRELREVQVSAVVGDYDEALSPWELHSQQQHVGPVTNATSASWVLRQQMHSHVVVCFSSPRCYACQEFAKVFEQVASIKSIKPESTKSITDTLPAVVFAKVNVDEVGIARLHLDFDRLPSVFVFPRGRGLATIAYTSRSFIVADVLAFVEESCPP